MSTLDQPSTPHLPHADHDAHHTLALNPLIGLGTQDFLGAAKTVFKAAVRRPEVAVSQWLSFLGELGKIVTSSAEERPIEPGEKRFSDPAWKTSRLHRKILQSYFAWADAVRAYVEKVDLTEQDRLRARLVAGILIDAVAPTNALFGNPAALKKVVDTGGESLWAGVKNYVADLVKNGGLPSQVDTRPFKVGVNLATTPGAVVHRDERYELIQYQPTTPQVWRRPIVVVPPQINKFYSLDLSPEKSLIRFLLSQGLQVFCISWRNPKRQHHDWGLADYVDSIAGAVATARKIAGSEDVSMMGACSGGITACAYAAREAGRGNSPVKTLTLLVCALDPSTAEETPLGSLITPFTLEAAREHSREKGLLDGRELQRVFAWMRPNDLIWNYWVSNYLMGNAPPAFDILYWNNDSTSLPARLHSDFLDLITLNPFHNPGALKLSGTPIDLGKVAVDAFVVSGVTDHITPWKSVYQTARLIGDKTSFVLSNAGHLQSLLNPPGNPKATYGFGVARFADPEAFAAAAEKRAGSWWTQWGEWLAERSGEKVAAPGALGNDDLPPREAAPGSYVFNA
jgi:polyhydroxyalkanoate synthase subunit PhaC